MYIYDELNNAWIKITETHEYHLRKKKLRTLWTALLIGIIFLPLAGQCLISLLATFLSFAYLDESLYKDLS